MKNMKKILLLLASASFVAPSVFAAGTGADDAEIVPAKGEYAVLISEKTLKQKDWKAAAAKFVKRYNGKLIVWRGNDVSSAKNVLKKTAPRYVAVVAAPEEIDRVFVAKLHKLSREMNDDIYGDFLWGIVTGKDGATAGTLLGKDKPLILDRALGTTNFDQKRFKKSAFITDWGPREFIETENYVSSEKTNAPADAEMVDIFAKFWEEKRPQFLISASHATEFNLEMPFGEGLIASAGTDFYLVPRELRMNFVYTLGKEAKAKELFKKENLKKLPKTPDEKVWFASGNCLFGDALRTPFSMVITAISAANVKQFVGYTVPTWFGEGGWGSSGQFFGGHQATSVGQAWFFNNQILLKNLPEALVHVPVRLNPDGMGSLNMEEIAMAVLAKQVEPTRELMGRIHDRDTVAFYGDPLYRTRFNPDAPSTQPWNCTVSRDSGTQNFTVKTTGGNAHKGDFCLWFPERVLAEKTAASIVGGNEKTEVEPDILTENFVIFRGLELKEGETLKISTKPGTKK